VKRTCLDEASQSPDHNETSTDLVSDVRFGAIIVSRPTAPVGEIGSPIDD